MGGEVSLWRCVLGIPFDDSLWLSDSYVTTCCSKSRSSVDTVSETHTQILASKLFDDIISSGGCRGSLVHLLRTCLPGWFLDILSLDKPVD